MTALKNVEIYVVTHRKIDFALPSYCSKIQVNAERNGQWDGYLHDNDNQNDNISLKNTSYAELTALYSMWKNCTADIQGVFHYRRYITGKFGRSPAVVINSHDVSAFAIKEQAIVRELEDADILLTHPINEHSNSNYCNVMELFLISLHREYMITLCNLIEECYPEYAPSLWQVLRSNTLSNCNMFIACLMCCSDLRRKYFLKGTAIFCITQGLRLLWRKFSLMFTFTSIT